VYTWWPQIKKPAEAGFFIRTIPDAHLAGQRDALLKTAPGGFSIKQAGSEH